VLLPLAAGSVTAALDVARGSDWSLVLVAAATSFGSSLIIVSGVWLVDRIYGALKHLDAARKPREVAASTDPKTPRRGRKT
jgi:hypothetical protein